jgi:hypothetical protein
MISSLHASLDINQACDEYRCQPSFAISSDVQHLEASRPDEHFEVFDQEDDVPCAPPVEFVYIKRRRFGETTTTSPYLFPLSKMEDTTAYYSYTQEGSNRTMLTYEEPHLLRDAFADTSISDADEIQTEDMCCDFDLLFCCGCLLTKKKNTCKYNRRRSFSCRNHNPPSLERSPTSVMAVSKHLQMQQSEVVFLSQHHNHSSLERRSPTSVMAI